MSLKSQFYALRYLENFSDEIQNLKKIIMKMYAKEKFKKPELLIALEKLTEYENNIYKKFNFYQSIVEDVEIQILYENFSNIKKRCQKFLLLYQNKLNYESKR